MDKVRTGVFQDGEGYVFHVECKLETNFKGQANLALTWQKAQDKLGASFKGWVYDLTNKQHLSALACYFLSPNQLFIEVWVDTEEGICHRKVTRQQLDTYQKAAA